jgi:hypothetical protein
MNRSEISVWLPEKALVHPEIPGSDKKFFSDLHREASVLRITR